MPPRDAFETTGLSKGDAIYALDLFQARVGVFYEDVPGATLWVAYDMRLLRARLQKKMKAARDPASRATLFAMCTELDRRGF